MYAELAQIGMNIAGGWIGAQKQYAEDMQRAALQEQNNADAWNSNLADNKTIAQVNLQNTIRTAYRTGLLNVQRGQMKKQEAQSGITLGSQRLKAMSSANANAAAAGSIGASVDAVTSDIMQQAEMADASIVEDSRIKDDNFDTQLNDILESGKQALRDPASINIRKVKTPEAMGWGEIVGNALINFGSQYASQYMSLGMKQGGGGSGGSGGGGDSGGGGSSGGGGGE